MKKRFQRSQRGSVAVAAVVALVVLLTLVVGMILAGQSVLASGRHEMRARGAIALAEAGVEYGYWQYSYQRLALPFTVSRALGDGTFSVTVSANGSTIQRSIKLVSTATLAGDKRTVTRVLTDPFYTVKITGTVFEDVNYGGGAGRSLSGSGGVRLPNARVELYDASGNFSSAVLTDSSGLFTFPGVLNGASGSVRVVSSTVRSSRSGSIASLLPVLTFRTKSPGAGVTDYVGGENPVKSDAGNGSTTLAALSTASSVAQCVAPITVGTDDLTGVDFGFNFDTVVNINDSGAGSLRQCLTNANTLSNSGLAQSGLTAGVENIVWMLPDGTARAGQNAGYSSAFSTGYATIIPTSAFPALSQAVILDASQQPGWSSTPIVVLRGDSAGSGVTGLSASVSGCVFKSLIVNRFGGAGISLPAGGTVSSCFVGTTASGYAAAGNNSGVTISGGSVSSVTGNVISGNTGNGLTLSGGAIGAVVTGNSIGTNVAGTAAVGNWGHGISVSGASGCTLGGTAGGAGNLVSGNGSYGIFLSGAGTTGNTLQGNKIGLTTAGTAALGNNGGLWLSGASSNTIGGASAAAGNVISGNSGVGVTLSSGATGNTFQGNSIGTNAAGSAALANSGGGVTIDASNTNTFGGLTAGSGNVISGNTGVGISLTNGASGNTLTLNVIGSNAAQTISIPNTTDGLVITNSNTNTIGATPATYNAIAANGRYGVLVSGSSSGNIIQSNGIVSNASVGVVITATPSGAGNKLTANAIYSNGGIGIDLGANGVSANDGVKNAASPNAGMDFPVFTSATISGSTLTVAGYVGSAAGQSVFGSARVEFFKSDNDGSGYGEGSAYLGTLTANASGNFSGSISVSGLSSGNKISAIAIDSNSNSSEFGPNFTLP